MNIKPISDLGLIAGLMALGYQPLEKVKEPNGKRINFMFEADDYFDQLCEDYYNNRMEVDAFKYFIALKEVKTGIYQLTQLENN